MYRGGGGGWEVLLLHLNIGSFFILLAFDFMVFAAGVGKLVVPTRAIVSLLGAVEFFCVSGA